MSKFTDFGYTQAQIDEKFQQVLDTIFTNEETKFYYDNGDGTAYFTDTGNDDVRTEGMSYGMMIALQLDDQVMFNKFWAWVNKYMLSTDGPMHGFFKWSAQRSGVSNAEGSAPDGEEFFAAALLMAANRWGDGEGIFNYTAEAKALLHEMVHKDEEEGGRGMFDPETTYIRFVAEMDISDPSYHLPHFYEVYAQYGNEEDRAFFERAADASREYLKKAMNPETGMSAEYANYDGTPNDFRGHGSFFSDAYRTAANVGLDAAWTGKVDAELTDRVVKLQEFYKGQIEQENIPVYWIDGTIVGDKETEDGQSLLYVKHPVALKAGMAQSTLATPNNELSKYYVDLFWNMPMRDGVYRYYDNLLYLFAFMALAGMYNKYDKQASADRVLVTN